MIVRDAIPLKQRIVFVAALVIALAVANVLAHLANGFNPYRTDEVQYTAGLETMPVVLVAMRALNFVTLGHIERGDQRGHLVLTGRLSRDNEKTARIIDFILSLSAAACAVLIARWASRTAARDV